MFCFTFFPSAELSPVASVRYEIQDSIRDRSIDRKYGHQVYSDLKKAGYKVCPVNPNATEILGNKCYPDLRSLPMKPHIVNAVVLPEITEKIVKTCGQLDITTVWMQPGSESEKQSNTVKTTESTWYTASASWYKGERISKMSKYKDPAHLSDLFFHVFTDV